MKKRAPKVNSNVCFSKIKKVYLKNVYCKLQIKNMSYAHWFQKKICALTIFESTNRFIYEHI